MSSEIQPAQPVTARLIRKYSVAIIIAWLAIGTALVVFVPRLEKVGAERSASLSPKDGPSVKALKRVGELFNEGDSDNMSMILFESDQALGDVAHKYYDDLVRVLVADTKHVQHVQDFWGDPLTAAGSQSSDTQAAYVQVTLVGDQGSAAANASIRAVRKMVESTPHPDGIRAYVTGSSPLIADMQRIGDSSMAKITITTAVVIFVMLLFVYRSPVIVTLLLLTVGVELAAARGIVSILAINGAFGLSTFAVSLLTSLAVAAGTDYGIFVIGRYQEALQAGADHETAYYTMYSGVIHVILGSGLTIAGGTFCLTFARLPYFHTLGIPCAVGMLVAVVVALTLGPAVVAFGGRFGLFDPKRVMQDRGWRRVGTAVVRWPVPILAATCVVALVGLLVLPGYSTRYSERAYLPGSAPAVRGLAAADRHFPEARLKPEILLIESNHDMRNPADFLIIDKLTKGVFHIQGISQVQAVTRPDGTTMDHSSIPFRISMQNAAQIQELKFQQDRADDMLLQADAMTKSIATLQRMYDLMMQMSDTMHSMVSDTDGLKKRTDELRDRIADFDDFWRPIRAYFHWDQHCSGVPICWMIRSIFQALDGVDQISEKVTDLLGDERNMDRLMPLTAQNLLPQIEAMETLRSLALTMHDTMSGMYKQMAQLSENATAMGQAFDVAKNDDSFYLPPEVFENENFARVMKLFMTADGHATRLIILHRDDPQSADEIQSINAIRTAAAEALKGTPLQDAKIYVTGVAAATKDIHDGAKWDLLIAGISSLCLIFVIMLVITRAFIGAAVIVGTVALSLGASFGLSVLCWQYILGIQLHWLVLPMAVIILLAVGSDYNLLLVSRMRQELGAGLNTGIIRAMGGTGKVVTNAGLVFAATLASMVVSDLRIIGQVGTTIGLGLLFDTLVVRSFMTPAIAALLGRWFWWPMRVWNRPVTVARRGSNPASTSAPTRHVLPHLKPR